MNKVIALVGNPNCGKTTLFNKLTGTYQRVGNWTGVTTEKKEGQYKKDKEITVVDLPGLYSLSGGAADERAALNFLTKNSPDVVVNVIDGTNLERSLNLTIDLIKLQIPMIIAVNMFDELKNNGIELSVSNLSNLFGLPVIPISALKNVNLDKLMQLALKTHKPRLELNKKLLQSMDGQARYSFIEQNIGQIIKRKQTKAERITESLDKFLMHRFFAIPFFFLVMTLVYFLSIKVGGFFGGHILSVSELFSERISLWLINLGVYEWVISLVCDTIIKTLGGVLSFLPQILILFMLMAIIEESGYAARIAVIFDRLFKTFGLSGKSLLPMIVSCGCTVTGLMSTRTIEKTNERRMTVFLSPFMPCGAKTAVFAWFATVFFNQNALVAASMYFLSIICVCVFGLILKRFKAFKGEGGAFIIEIPILRLPSVKDVFMVMWEKTKEFMSKAALIVFAVTVFLWLLKSVGVSGYVGNQVEKSFLFDIANILKYLFYPLGFYSWQTVVAIICGFFAKEAVIESLNLLSQDAVCLFSGQYSAYAFMAYILLSPPCIASIAAAKRELGSTKWLLFMITFQTVAAYLVAFIINTLGFIFTGSLGLILSSIIVIMLSISLILAIIKLKRHKCKLCRRCKKGTFICKKQKPFTT